MSIIRVALDVPLPRLFDYVAEGLSAQDLGRCVLVPFGSGQKVGVIVGIAASSEQPIEKLKPVTQVLEDIPKLPAEWIAVCEFCARYYQHPLGEVVNFALPPMIRRGKLPRRNKTSDASHKENHLADSAPANAKDLNAEQRLAVDTIAGAGGFETFLLHGITGSGKTEVYLQAIEAILQQGKQALMLVPEIALTPQLEERVASRFPSAHVVSAHSGIGDAARARAFLEALSGQAHIVLGTRLAVFMPMARLGLIVVDEEHDPSFKQQEGCAIRRAILPFFAPNK